MIQFSFMPALDHRRCSAYASHAGLRLFGAAAASAAEERQPTLPEPTPPTRRLPPSGRKTGYALKYKRIAKPLILRTFVIVSIVFLAKSSLSNFSVFSVSPWFSLERIR
jgi:hypothetical protein